MADFIREMDPLLRTALVIFLAVFLKAVLFEWWERFKTRESAKPVRMKLRRGVHVPWGVVERAQRVMNVIFWIWLAWMIAMLVVLAYMKIMGIPRLF